MPLTRTTRALSCLAFTCGVACAALGALPVVDAHAAGRDIPSFIGQPVGAAPLSAAIASSMVETGRRIVSVVTADIDDDGDLDVVASDGSLDLVVLVNDGAGHLSLKHPSHSEGWQPVAPGPGVGERGSPSTPSTQNDPPSFGVAWQPLSRPIDPVRRLLARPDVIAHVLTPSARHPRAPPAAA
jgi:hypothetical protein